MSPAPIYIEAFGLACALGPDAASISRNLFAVGPPSAPPREFLIDGRDVPVGRLSFELQSRAGETRTNCLLAHCFAQIAQEVAAARARFGAQRLAIVLGACTTGIAEAGEAMAYRNARGDWPGGFKLQAQQLDDGAWFLANLAKIEGPTYSISTACTSGARALAAGARLLRAGLCDAVLCGGADSLSPLTLNGFAALESLSQSACNPMSAHRDGIHIGEAGALFLLTRAPCPYRLSGWGESADSYHISAPDPSGAGAERALRGALAKAGLTQKDIGFVHMHGTATRLNDAMEAAVLHRVFGEDLPSASTKPLTGHTLGTAGALQAAFCIMSLQERRLPPHHWDGVRDPDLPSIRLVGSAESWAGHHALSASYAFGGNNCALVISRE